jgi:hypothetical protein
MCLLYQTISLGGGVSASVLTPATSNASPVAAHGCEMEKGALSNDKVLFSRTAN